MLSASNPSASSTRRAASTIASRESCGRGAVRLGGRRAHGGSGIASGSSSGEAAGGSGVWSSGLTRTAYQSRTVYDNTNTVRVSDVIAASEGFMGTSLQREPSPATASGPEAAIVVHELVKTYPGDVRALDGLSFTVEPGTVFG